MSMKNYDNIQYLVCGNGKPSNVISTYTDKKFQLIQSSLNFKVENIYLKDNAVLLLIQGDLYKEGQLNFEKSDNEEINYERNLVKLIPNTNLINSKEYITDLSVGDNHILLLTKSGNVYSWGDNYYGQLGLDNPFIAKLFEPHQLKLPKVQRIYTYKNNSFAIDVNNKLWVWGKNEYLGASLKGNIFKPTQILSHLNIDKIKVNDDRIILAAMESNELISGRRKEDEEEEANQSENEEYNEKEEEIKNEQAVKFTNQNNSNLRQLLHKVNEDIHYAFTSFGPDNSFMRDLRSKILSDQSIIKKIGLESIWSEINQVINQNNKNNLKHISKTINTQIVSFNDTVDVFAGALNTILTGCFHQINVDKIITRFVSMENEISKAIAEIDAEDLGNDEIVNIFYKNIQTLLEYFLKYKKIEVLIHKMSAHQFLLKSFKFENVLEGLKFISTEENIEKKLYMIERTFDSLKILIEKTNSSFNEIEDVFGSLNKLSLTDEDKNAEIFLHKHIIESTFNIKDLWSNLIIHIENELKSKYKIDQVTNITERYKELYSIHMYIRSINIKNVFESDINKAKSSYDEDLKIKICKLMMEIDGAISKLENILKDRLTQNKYDIFSNELLVTYASSILDNAYQKKIFFEVVYSIERKSK